MYVLRGIRSGLDFILGLIGGGLLVFTTLLIFLAVVQRYVFNDPMQYSFDLATLLFAWLVFLGLYTADQRSGLQIPSLRISAHWLYLSLPIGFSLLALSRAFKMTEFIAQRHR